MKIFQGVLSKIETAMENGSGFCFSRNHFVTFAETLDQAIEKAYDNFETAPSESNHLYIVQTDKDFIDYRSHNSTIITYKINKPNPHGRNEGLEWCKKNHPDQYYQNYDEPPECLINCYKRWASEKLVGRPLT
jgi:hypothetical protein